MQQLKRHLVHFTSVYEQLTQVEHLATAHIPLVNKKITKYKMKLYASPALHD